MNNKQQFPPDLSDVLDSVKAEIFTNINCVQIGEIQEYDSETQSATIKLLIKQVMKENYDGSKVLQEFPLLLDCPCFALSGGGAYIHFPVTAGDSCIVLFNDRDIDNWFTDGTSAPPNSYRKHDLSDGIALIGIRSLKDAISETLVNLTRLHHSATSHLVMTDVLNTMTVALLSLVGSMTISGGLAVGGLVTSLGGGTIQIDSPVQQINGNDFTTTGDVSDSNTTTPTMQQMRDLFNTHTHGGGSAPTQQM